MDISEAYTQRQFNWKDWKAFQQSKELATQFFDDGSKYIIWGYDGPEVYMTSIFTAQLPEEYLRAGYSQEQNDNDRLEFETNYKPEANKRIRA